MSKHQRATAPAAVISSGYAL